MTRIIATTLMVAGVLIAGCSPVASPAAPTVPSKAAAPLATPKPQAQQPRSGGILYISHFADPISYDPIQESSLQSQALIVPCYSGIVQHDPIEPAKVIGDLAEKWDTSPDGLSYTFQLYKNVKWHDGSLLTSADALFSLDTVRKPPKGVTSPRQEWLKAIDKIETPDKDTIRITLSYPSASFLDNLGDGRMVVVPKQIFETKGSMKRDIVGTGPYRFKAFTPGASFSVVKNPDYFVKGRPYLDGMTWYVIGDVATRFAALRTHRVQMTPKGSQGLTPSQSEIMRKEMSDKIVVQPGSSLNLEAFWMPHNKAPWSDVRVRRAVQLVIDRPKIIKVREEGRGDVGGFMPPGIWSLPEAELMNMPGYRQPKDADIAEAKRLMAEAGYTQGIKTTTIARNIQQQERGTVALKEQLAQIGIDITVSLKDQGTMFDLLYKRSYDTAVFSGASSYDDPDQVFGQVYVTGVPRNFSDFSDERIDKWYDEQSRAMDPAKRKEIVLNMQRRMHELIPASITVWTTYELGNWVEVKDFKVGIGLYNNLKFQNVWLDK